VKEIKRFRPGWTLHELTCFVLIRLATCVIKGRNVTHGKGMFSTNSETYIVKTVTAVLLKQTAAHFT